VISSKGEDSLESARYFYKVFHLVEVLKHGWLTNDHGNYFIDMEYCIQTLEDFIRDIEKESQVGAKRQNDLGILNDPETVGPVIPNDDAVSAAAMREVSTTDRSADPMQVDDEQHFSETISPQTLIRGQRYALRSISADVFGGRVNRLGSSHNGTQRHCFRFYLYS